MYNNLFSELYDVFYSQKDYAAEADFLASEILAATTGTKIVEFACGTGKHALELARRGFSVHGFDLSEDMIRVATKNNRSFAQNQFEQGDMTCCGPGNGIYDVALILFDSLGYLKTNNLILQTLANVRRNIKPGGLFIAEVWHAGAFLPGYEPVREKNWTVSDGHIKRISRTKVDLENQVAQVHFEVLATLNGQDKRCEELHICRFFLASEFRLFLETAGFKDISVRPGFKPAKTPVTGLDFHLVVTARS